MISASCKFRLTITVRPPVKKTGTAALIFLVFLIFTLCMLMPEWVLWRINSGLRVVCWTPISKIIYVNIQSNGWPRLCMHWRKSMKFTNKEKYITCFVSIGSKLILWQSHYLWRMLFFPILHCGFKYLASRGSELADSKWGRVRDGGRWWGGLLCWSNHCDSPLSNAAPSP